MRYLFFLLFIVIASIATAQTKKPAAKPPAKKATQASSKTPKPTFEKTVAYLEQKLNSLKEELDELDASTRYEAVSVCSDFTILKEGVDSILVLKVKEIRKYRFFDVLINPSLSWSTEEAHITIPLCYFSEIIYERSGLSGYNEASIQNSKRNIGRYNIGTGKTLYYSTFSFGLRKEDDDTFVKLRKAFLNLRSYCPKLKRDLFDN